MSDIRAYLLDLDGTLYRGSEPIEGAMGVVAELRRRGAAIRFITNNSTQTLDFYAGKLRRMGFKAEPSEVISSALGTGRLMREWGLDRAFVLGEPGLVETLSGEGIGVVNWNGERVEPSGPLAQAVVVGLCRSLSYEILSGAMQQIRAGARFVATNPDATFPTEGHGLTPGAGSIVAAVRTCSGSEPFIVGKPSPYLIQMALQGLGVAPEEALVVGDRMDTDIESGKRAGCPTHLVLTGIEDSAPPGQAWSQDLRGLLSG